MRALITLAVLLMSAYLGLCALLYVQQRSLLYFPRPRALPAEESLFTLEVDGAALVVTHRPGAAARANALIYFGGNGEDVSISLAPLAEQFPDHALYLMHYRGYGGSGGTPSEQALKADALALFDQVRGQHGQIALIGRSLGSGVAIHVAARRAVSRLGLITPYDSLVAIAAENYPVFPVHWLMIDQFRSLDDVPLVQAPTLVLLAEEDQIIPRANSERLIAAFAPQQVTVKVIEGTGHNSISSSAWYWESLRQGLTAPQTAQLKVTDSGASSQ